MANVTEFAIKVTDQSSAALSRMGAGVGGLKTAFAALAVALPIAKIGQMMNASLQAADEAGKAAQKIGISTSAYMGMAHAADLAGVSSGSLIMGMKSLSVAMAEGANSTLPAAQQLRALGIASRDAQGNMRPMNTVLLEIADKFATSRDDASKAAAAVDLFGRAGLDMIPMLNAGSESINGVIAQAEKLGLVMGDDLAASAEAVNDTMAVLGKVMQGAVNKAMVAIAPVMEEITGKLLNMATEGDTVERMAQGLIAVFRSLMTVGAILNGVFQVVGKGLATLALAAMQIASGEFSAAWDTIKTGGQDMAGAVSASLESIQSTWSETAQSAAASTARQLRDIRKLGEGMARASDEVKVKADTSEADREKANKAHLARMKEEDSRLAEDQKRTQQDLQFFRMSLFDQESAYQTQRLLDDTTKLQEWRAAELISEEEHALMLREIQINHNASLGDLGAQYQQAMLNIDKAGGMGRVALQLQFGQQILSGLATQSKAAFNIQKGMAIAETTINTYRSAVSAYQSLVGIPLIGPVLATVAAASAIAFGMTQVSQIKGQSFGGAAHGGMDYVPNESTYLLQQGERVLSPRQNRDLTGFMENGQGGGGTIGTVEIHILENATNADAFSRMDRAEIRERLGQPVITALNEMFRIGVRPDFASAAT